MANEHVPWRIVATKESITQNADDSTLALRLGIAVNALHAAQRFYLSVKDAPGPGGERDRLWAFLIAIGFIHEAIQLLRPNFPRVKELAQNGGASEETVTAAGNLLSGRIPLGRTIDRMRNKLIFHWDDDVIREYVTRFTANELRWAEGFGDTQGESALTASANALTNSVLPDEPQATEERNLERIRELVGQIPTTTKVLLELFYRAIMGHLGSYEKRLEPEQTPTTQPIAVRSPTEVLASLRTLAEQSSPMELASFLSEQIHSEQSHFWSRFAALTALHAGLLVVAVETDGPSRLLVCSVGIILWGVGVLIQRKSLEYVERWKKPFRDYRHELGLTWYYEMNEKGSWWKLSSTRLALIVSWLIVVPWATLVVLWSIGLSPV